MNSHWSQILRRGVWIRSSSFYRYPNTRPSSPAFSPRSLRSAIRIRVSAVRLEHVPTFLFFMCATPRAMGRSLVTIYTVGDFSFPRSFPVFTSTTVDRRVPFRRRWVYMGTGYPSESNDPSPLPLFFPPSNLSLPRIHIYTRLLSFSLLLLFLSLHYGIPLRAFAMFESESRGIREPPKTRRDSTIAQDL